MKRRREGGWLCQTEEKNPLNICRGGNGAFRKRRRGIKKRGRMAV
jgi:hypothetical protein